MMTRAEEVALAVMSKGARILSADFAEMEKTAEPGEDPREAIEAASWAFGAAFVLGATGSIVELPPEIRAAGERHLEDVRDVAARLWNGLSPDETKFLRRRSQGMPFRVFGPDEEALRARLHLIARRAGGVMRKLAGPLDAPR